MTSDRQILVIDFEPRRLSETRVLLERKGYATIGVGALKELEPTLQASLPSVVLMEPMLPGYDGFALCRDLKSGRFGKLPHVIVAARIFKGQRYRTMAKDAGADAYLQRPEHDELLLKMLQELLPERAPEPAPAPMELELEPSLTLTPPTTTRYEPLPLVDPLPLDQQLGSWPEPAHAPSPQDEVPPLLLDQQLISWPGPAHAPSPHDEEPLQLEISQPQHPRGMHPPSQPSAHARAPRSPRSPGAFVPPEPGLITFQGAVESALASHGIPEAFSDDDWNELDRSLDDAFDVLAQKAESGSIEEQHSHQMPSGPVRSASLAAGPKPSPQRVVNVEPAQPMQLPPAEPLDADHRHEAPAPAPRKLDPDTADLLTALEEVENSIPPSSGQVPRLDRALQVSAGPAVGGPSPLEHEVSLEDLLSEGRVSGQVEPATPAAHAAKPPAKRREPHGAEKPADQAAAAAPAPARAARTAVAATSGGVAAPAATQNRRLPWLWIAAGLVLVGAAVGYLVMQMSAPSDAGPAPSIDAHRAATSAPSSPPEATASANAENTATTTPSTASSPEPTPAHAAGAIDAGDAAPHAASAPAAGSTLTATATATPTSTPTPTSTATAPPSASTTPPVTPPAGAAATDNRPSVSAAPESSAPSSVLPNATSPPAPESASPIPADTSPTGEPTGDKQRPAPQSASAIISSDSNAGALVPTSSRDRGAPPPRNASETLRATALPLPGLTTAAPTHDAGSEPEPFDDPAARARDPGQADDADAVSATAPVIEMPPAQASLPVLIAGSRVPPAYPTLAKRTAREGVVKLLVQVDTRGIVTRTRVLEEDPAELGFAVAAANAVRRWRYSPAIAAGQPIESQVTVTINFKPH